MKNVIIVLFILTTYSSFAQQERKFVRQGNKEFEKEKYDQAEVDYRKALEKTPDSKEAQYNLAGSVYRQKKFDEAANSYLSLTSAAKSKEESAKYFHNLGNSYLQAGKLKESIEAYKNALRNNPADDETRYNLAYAMNKMQQQQQQQQNKDNKQDKNQNKDKDKKDKQQQQQQQQQQQKQQQKQQEEKQAQQKENKISKEDAERMLQAIMNEEKDTQKKVKEQQVKASNKYIEKEW